jgi:EAL domain-containing protein (putative c-di-GMP-specific phosphodiesterase class I)
VRHATARLDRVRDKYSARFTMAYKLTAAVVAALSLIWAMLFSTLGNQQLGLMQAGTALVAIASWFLAHRGMLAKALLLTQAAFLVLIVLLCLIFDVPSAEVPRVSHLFLLVLALMGYLNYKRQPSHLQLGLIGLCLLCFVGLSSNALAMPLASPIPEEIRFFGSWVNAAIATALLAGGIYLFQYELEHEDRRADALKAALWGKQFELFYQPQVDVTGRVIGAEALLRWKHPSRGYISPGEFIPMAEEAGLMDDIGDWVLETSCRTLVDWSRNPETQHLTLSANVSASQFLDEDFEQRIIHLVDTFKVDPTRLKLELTESVMVSNTDIVAGKMQVLRSTGMRLALDDFGTGFSALGYLRRLPLNELKIDRSFVHDVTENERSATFARSIIQIGRDLGLAVLAEGVESASQFALLRESGCETFQGFYFGRPVPLAEFEASLPRVAA